MHEFPDLLPWEEMTALVKRHEEQLNSLQERVERSQQFFNGSVLGVAGRMYEMEGQIEALEKVVADLTASIPQPEKGVESVVHARFIQALGRLTPEQKRMLDEAQEDDCIF